MKKVTLGTNKLKIGICLSLVLLLVIATTLFVGKIFSPKVEKDIIPFVEGSTETVTNSTDTPEEEPPTDNFVWVGKSNDPKYIRLPSVSIEGYIQNVGIDQNSQIAVPNNVHFGGWFVDTVRPGELGLSIIDGHLNGTSRGGIFRNLKNVKVGDEFEVEIGDGTTQQYRVIDTQTLDNDKAADVLFSQKFGILSQLNLITCGGTYDKSAKIYEQRVIVISEHIGSY
jgi:LPXTG-site transpeptidase (sortase) family protein